jgi:glycosyltransferase involved in cell wall biosynthesis
MRIGLITGEYPPMRGGIATQTYLLAKHLTQRGHDVFVMTDARGNNPIDGVHLRAEVTHWGFNRTQQMRQWAVENELDVVNLHYQTAAYNMSPVIHFLPNFINSVAPFITTFHDLRFPYLFPKAGPLRPWIVNRLARTSSGVVGTNEEDFATLQSHNAQAQLIPIGSNIVSDESSDIDAHGFLDVDKSTFVMAFFGFINHSKGVDVLLQALSSLRRRGIPARLLMIGDRTGSSDATNAAYADEIERIIADEGLSDAVRWTGFVDDADVRAYLQSANVVVMPFRDGASYRRSSLISAIESKCAIVTTAPVVSVPTFINGENMLIVPSDDVPALTSALEHLYNNPALREHLREGTTILSKTFSWDQIVASYTNLYREVIESNA